MNRPRYDEAAFPKLIAVVDYYESDACPHCGAGGKHVFRFICDDGKTRAAMRGCLKLFKPGPDARLLQEAFKRVSTGQAASWWREMVNAATQLTEDRDLEAFRATVANAENRRQSWLRKNGFKH
jgi:hypothetical protein